MRRLSRSPNLVVLIYCAVQMLRLSRSPNPVVLNYCAVRMLCLSRSPNFVALHSYALDWRAAIHFQRENVANEYRSKSSEKPLVNRTQLLPRIARGLRPTITMSLPTRARAQTGRKSTGDKSKILNLKTRRVRLIRMNLGNEDNDSDNNDDSEDEADRNDGLRGEVN